MADKTVKITFEIDGLQQSVTNIDDAKVALQQLETQAKKTEDAAEGAADEFRESTKAKLADIKALTAKEDSLGLEGVLKKADSSLALLG